MKLLRNLFKKMDTVATNHLAVSFFMDENNTADMVRYEGMFDVPQELVENMQQWVKDKYKRREVLIENFIALYNVKTNRVDAIVSIERDETLCSYMTIVESTISFNKIAASLIADRVRINFLFHRLILTRKNFSITFNVSQDFASDTYTQVSPVERGPFSRLAIVQ